MPGHVLGGVNETAKDHGLKAILDQVLDLTGSALELLICLDRQRIGTAGEIQEPAPSGVDTTFGIGAGTYIQGHSVIGVILVEHCPSTDFLHFLVAGLVRRGTPTKSRGCGGRTG